MHILKNTDKSDYKTYEEFCNWIVGERTDEMAEKLDEYTTIHSDPELCMNNNQYTPRHLIVFADDEIFSLAYNIETRKFESWDSGLARQDDEIFDDINDALQHVYDVWTENWKG
ncbi:hypothetical protein QUF80_05450 [Desulfococcaceae bacterium HSG8]|nr:hypothetical protein [Desulfococcaceae bacterium HSG8]